MKKIGTLLSLLILAAPAPALAVCPICTIAVGAGLGLSRWLGIDDTITGVWVGGFLASLTLWTINWMEGKKINFPWRGTVTAAAYYLLTFIPLYLAKIVGHPYNQLWGIDKLVFGTVIGSIFFLISVKYYEQLKTKNNGRPWFPYQKIVWPLAILTIASLIFYLIIKV